MSPLLNCRFTCSFPRAGWLGVVLLAACASNGTTSTEFAMGAAGGAMSPAPTAGSPSDPAAPTPTVGATDGAPPVGPTDAPGGVAVPPVTVPVDPTAPAAAGGAPPTMATDVPPATGGVPPATTVTPPTPAPGGTATRPLLSDADAANFEILDYLRQAGAITAPVVDDWDPTAGVALPAAPDVVVAPGQSVQAAINAATGPNRVFIQLMPGTYRETVCVPATAPPITLYGANDADPTAAVIIFDNLAGRLPAAVTTPNTCLGNNTGATLGTDRSATFATYAANFEARSLTISNDADESEAAANGNTGTQAVALFSRGDRAIYQNVRLLGHQDTVEFKSSSTEVIARTYIRDSYIEGDVDFIFGRGTAVIDNTEIRSVLTRTGEVRTSGNILAPSSDARNSFGILIINSTFTTDTAAAGRFTLGRAWDEGQILERDPNDPADDTRATYAENIALGIFPNGQAVVRNSTLGAHLNMVTPWAAAATTARAFSSTPYSTADGDFPANRLFEYSNMAQ